MFLGVAETIVGLHSGGVGIVQSFFNLLNYVIGLLQLPLDQETFFFCFFSPYTLTSPAWLTANLGFSKVECLI